MTINRWTDPDDIRFYDTPIGMLVSSTSVLKVLHKPALPAWSARLSAEFLGKRLLDLKEGRVLLSEDNYREEIDALVKEAKGQHALTLAQRGERGTNIHHAIYEYFTERKRPEEDGSDTPLLFKSFLSWWADYRPDGGICEETVWSKKGYAGTLDMVAEFGGEVDGFWINDFKSGKAIYDEAIMQVASYLYAWEERGGTRAQGAIVTRLHTTGYEVKVYTRAECREAFKRFKYLLAYVLANNRRKEKLKKSLDNGAENGI